MSKRPILTRLLALLARMVGRSRREAIQAEPVSQHHISPSEPFGPTARRALPSIRFVRRPDYATAKTRVLREMRGDR
jgi:hypothetical protein